jgi:exodeoxyribonuclease V gamma subunit
VTLELRISARPEPLIDELAQWLSVTPDDPFQSDLVVVPNAGIREWAATGLLARFGVLSHVDFVFPAELTRRALDLPDRAHDPWRPERLAWHVLALMESGIDLGMTPWEGVPARPWAVARRVADLLERYATQRPDLIGAWTAGEDTDGGAELAASRRWQAVTWRALRERVGEPSSAERLLAALAEPGPLAGDTEGGAGLHLPGRVALLGVSTMAAPFAAVLAHVACEREVLVLATAASPAAVHGVRGGVVSAIEPGLPSHVARPRSSEFDPETHPLLLTWGRPALEAASVLSRLPAVPELLTDTAERGDEPGGGRHLQLTALQEAVRDGVPAAPSTLDRGRDGDGSVQVHACHGLVRQLEVVRDAILHAMTADPTLSPRDIAVLCADLEQVAPLAGPILGADVDGRSLPVLVTDQAAATAPPVQAALDAALTLATSRLERDEVLTFLALPVVSAALGLGADDLDALESSADELDVRWGRDATHRTRWGYPPHLTIGTWRETLDRLLAGLLVDADGIPVGGIAPASSVATADLDRIGRLADALAVVGHLATLAERPRPMTAWAGPLRWVIDTVLRPHRAVDVETHGFAAQAAQVRAVLDELVADAAVVGLPIDLREVRAALADRLTSGGSRARMRTGHVSVASLTPLRGVPFRLVALVGVDDSLAASAGADDDDVLALAPRVGERDAADERRAALLDAMLAARDTLIVACDGQDVRTGQVLDLPTVVEELLDALPAPSPDHLGAPLVVRHPRHLADRRNLTVGHGSLPRRDVTRPWAFAPAAMRAVQALEAVDGVAVPGVGVLTEPTDLPRWRSVALPPRGPRPEEPAGSAPSSSEAPQLHLDDVMDALSDPTRELLRERLGIRLPKELASPPRPVELWVEDGLERWRLGDALLRHLAAGRSAEEWLAARPASGGIPPGRLGEELLAGFVEEVTDLHRLAGGAAPQGPITGPSTIPVGVEVDVDSAVLGPCRVRLVGSVEHHGGTIVDVGFSKDHPSHRLRAALHLLALTAQGPSSALGEAVDASRAASTEVDAARVVRRAPSSRDVAAVHELRVVGQSAEERAAIAGRALAQLVDLALRIRRGPAPLLPRASWRIGPDTDVRRSPTGDLAADVARDLGRATTRVVLGASTLPELAQQDDGVLEEGLPDAPTPVQRWSSALRGPIASAFGEVAT